MALNQQETQWEYSKENDLIQTKKIKAKQEKDLTLTSREIRLPKLNKLRIQFHSLADLH